MHSFDYDLLVIGAGSAGVRCARWSAGIGAKVAIIEEYRYGGTCVIRGCVPKKLMVYASEVHEEMAAAKNYGWSVDNLSFDWQTLKKNRDKEIQRLSDIYVGLLEGKNVDHFEGRGVFVDKNTVEVNGKKLSADKIVIATGSRPMCLDTPGMKELAWSSNDVFEADEQPKSLLVIGGGFIAVEMAGIFHGLGTEVEVCIRGKNILRGFDQECIEFAQSEIEKKGIKFKTNCNVTEMQQTNMGIEVKFDDGESKVFDKVLSATGRVPNTENLGLEKAGVKTGRKNKIEVSDKFQTNVENIYALGDCIDRIQLTPVATTEGTFLAEYLFNKKDFSMDYNNVASAVFCQPPLSTVGLTEEEAKEKKLDIDVYTSSFRALKHTLSGLEEKTFMKVIVNKKDNKVIGLHMVGKDAPEVIQLGAVCLKAGLTKDFFDQTIGIHPSSAEEFVTMRTKRD